MVSTVLVTGANRGIGLEFVRQYAEAGDRVIACARHPEAPALQKLCAAAKDRVSVHALDVTDPDAIAALATELRGQAIDILINNAGIEGEKSRGAIDYARWELVFRTNTIAPYRMAEAFHAHMKRATHPRIIGISSQLGSIAQSSGYAMDYGASKAALNHVMHSLAEKWARDRIIVIAMSPGWVRTDMGGGNAPLSVDESVRAMRGVIERLQPENSGQFLGHHGETLPW